MKNKITFFRFSNSKSALDYSIKNEEKEDKRILKSHKNHIDNNKNLVYKELTESQLKILENYYQTEKKFNQELYAKKKYTNVNFDSLLKSEKTINDIEFQFQKKIKEKFDLTELTNLVLQKKYNYNFKKFNEYKEIVEKNIPHERIEVQDMNELNEIVEIMNTKGWSVKQIEGIQSGVSADWNDGGYGYSFTQGIMIVWENNVAQQSI